MFHFMRLGLTTEGAETPVRAARKEACERIRFAQLGRNSPTLDGRQMICGRGVDEWHEVRLPPSSFRAPRSGFPRFQWLTDLSTAPRIKCAPSPDRGIDNSALSAQMDLTLFVYTRQHRVRFFLVESKSCFHAGDFVARRGAIASICAGPCGRLRRATRFLSTPVSRNLLPGPPVDTIIPLITGIYDRSDKI